MAENILKRFERESRKRHGWQARVKASTDKASEEIREMPDVLIDGHRLAVSNDGCVYIRVVGGAQFEFSADDAMDLYSFLKRVLGK